MIHRIILFLSLLIFCHEVHGKVKVVILAGQSNMAGYASINHLQELINNNPVYRETYSNADGTLKTRSDVKIYFNSVANERSDLEIGYGRNNMFGPEVGIGFTLGDYFDEPVFLIKIALGSTGLGDWWLPPSAYTDDTELTIHTGQLYRKMVRDVHLYTDNIPLYFPEYAGTNPEDAFEIIAFCWLQGWSDLLDDSFRNAYEENLQFLIQDVQTEFGASTAFLIGELGQGGDLSNYKHLDYTENIKEMRAIQQRVANAMGVNVRFVPTQQYTNEEKGRKAYDAFSHYWGRAETILDIGNAFGNTVIEEWTRTPEPSQSPSITLTPTISVQPTAMPSALPTTSAFPTQFPSVFPSFPPTVASSLVPSNLRSDIPSRTPTESPIIMPSLLPSLQPSGEPSLPPTRAPSFIPSVNPSGGPSLSPTIFFSDEPTSPPSDTRPTKEPTLMPSRIPSLEPTTSRTPSFEPTNFPSPWPKAPSTFPSLALSTQPSGLPTRLGENLEMIQAFVDSIIDSRPTNQPSHLPSGLPTTIVTSNEQQQAPPLDQTVDRDAVRIVVRSVRGSSSPYYNASLVVDELFGFSLPTDDEGFFEPTINITIYYPDFPSPENILQTMVIHTGCDWGFTPESIFGSIYVMPFPSKSDASNCDFSNLLLLQYVGGDCSQSSNPQDDFFICQDFSFEVSTVEDLDEVTGVKDNEQREDARDIIRKQSEEKRNNYSIFSDFSERR